MRPTPALARCVVLTAGVIATGISLHRADIVVLATPFVLGPLLSWHGRHEPTMTASVEVGVRAAGELEPVPVTVRVASDTELDAVNVILEERDFESVDGQTQWTLAVGRDGRTEITTELTAPRWGRRGLGPVRVVGRGAALLWETPVGRSRRVGVDIVPLAEGFRATSAVPNALAYSGDHRSASPGDGAHFSNVRPFGFGDRLRRINWRATLRTQQLHATATLSERSTRVVVVIDSAFDAGTSGNTVLDVAVRAAAAICDHYLSIGDVVGLAEYGGGRRELRAAPGRRQTDRVREWLLDVRALRDGSSRLHEEWLPNTSASRGLVFVLTPLLDEFSAQQLIALKDRGASVVAVNTYQDDERPATSNSPHDLGLRLWRLRRAYQINRLADRGIPVVTWAGAGSLDLVLQDVTRIATAPRLVLR